MSARKFGFKGSPRCKRRLQFETSAYMVSVLPGRESSSEPMNGSNTCQDVCWPEGRLQFGPQEEKV